MEFSLYRVGGAVRDTRLGLRSKDQDYTVVASDLSASIGEAFSEMRSWLTDQEFTIFVESPEHVTIRAKFPRAMEMPKGEQDADFVLARDEGPYSDGRHPDWVALGTLEHDLARRDFTVNALAESLDGQIIDRHGGLEDLKNKVLRCVGNSEDRMRQDSLRALRAIRFRITKGFEWADSLREVMTADWLPELLSAVSTERKQDELEKCLRVTTIGTLDILCHEVPREFLWACFGDTGPNSLWLRPSMEKR